MPGDPSVEELRDQIAEIDRSVLELVNTRLLLVQRLKELKEAEGVAFLDMQQEHRILRRLARENRGPLSERGVQELFGELLELTKRELRQRQS